MVGRLVAGVVLAVGLLAGCSDGKADDPGASASPDAEVTFPRPGSVDQSTDCEHWLRLPRDERTAYALHRLAEMRSNDGIEFAVDPPTEPQGSLLRTYMENQCRMDSMDVAAVWRVAHDQYTRLYDRRVLLD